MDAQRAQMLKPLSYKVVPNCSASHPRKLISNLQLSFSFYTKWSGTVATSQWQRCFLSQPQMQIEERQMKIYFSQHCAFLSIKCSQEKLMTPIKVAMATKAWPPAGVFKS